MKRKRARAPKSEPKKELPALPPGPSPEEIKAQEEQRQREEEEERRRRAEVEAQRKQERDAREAKMAALDEQIRILEAELTLHEKAFFDAQHAFERATVDLSFHRDEVSYAVAKEASDLLHDTRMLIITHKIAHDRLVDERNAMGLSKWQHWAILGFAALGAFAIYFHMLKGKKK